MKRKLAFALCTALALQLDFGSMVSALAQEQANPAGNAGQTETMIDTRPVMHPGGTKFGAYDPHGDFGAQGDVTTDAQLINFLGDGVGTNENGTPHQGILDMAANLGLPATQAGLGGDAAWIKAQLEAGKKVIVNGNFGLGGHYVTVTGVDPNGNFLVNDPYEGPRVITPAEMEAYQNANTHEGQIIGTAFAIG